MFLLIFFNIFFDKGIGNFGSSNFGNHFQNWLIQSNYKSLISIEGWGGSDLGDCLSNKEPILFIHGNGDFAQSWSIVRDSFFKIGYQPSELYAIGYGLKGPMNSSLNFHKASDMKNIRNMILAILEYTNSKKINIISHSLGVTLSRKSIKGGNAFETFNRKDIPINLGISLSNRISTFIGIAGANRGLNSCGKYGQEIPINTCGANGLSIISPFLVDLGYGGDEGDYRFTIFSWNDEIICYLQNCKVNDQHSSSLNEQTGFKEYQNLNHMALRDQTTNVLINMIINKTII